VPEAAAEVDAAADAEEDVPHHPHHAAADAAEVADAAADVHHHLHHHHLAAVAAEADSHLADAEADAEELHHHHPHAAEAASHLEAAEEAVNLMLLQPHLMLLHPAAVTLLPHKLPQPQLLPHNTLLDLPSEEAAVTLNLEAVAADTLDHKLPQLEETLMPDASKWHFCATSNSHSLSSNIISVRFIIGDRIGNETAPKTNLVFLHLLVLSFLFVCCSPQTTQLSVHFDDVGLMKKKYKEF
jgi:hypothetical protein